MHQRRKGSMEKTAVGLVLVILALLLFSGCSPVQQEIVEEHGHEHGEAPFEWSGDYTLPVGLYKLEFQESPHDPSCMVAFLLLQEERTDLEHLAHHIMEGAATEILPGGLFVVEDQYAYDLQLDPEGTVFNFEVVDAGTYVLFTEHFAWEFDLKIYDMAGREVPVANPTDHTEPHEHE